MAFTAVGASVGGFYGGVYGTKVATEGEMPDSLYGVAKSVFRAYSEFQFGVFIGGGIGAALDMTVAVCTAPVTVPVVAAGVAINAGRAIVGSAI